MSVLVLLVAASSTAWCMDDGQPNVASKADEAEAAHDLEVFAQSLTNETLNNKTALTEALVVYLQEHGPVYFGATVTVLDGDSGKAKYSPYVYRSGGANSTVVLTTDDLMDPSYRIDEQPWLREPIDTASAIWTEPYFDQGGGNVWMETRSQPIFLDTPDGGGDDDNGSAEVIAVATTDILVEDPTGGSSSRAVKSAMMAVVVAKCLSAAVALL